MVVMRLSMSLVFLTACGLQAEELLYASSTTTADLREASTTTVASSALVTPANVWDVVHRPSYNDLLFSDPTSGSIYQYDLTTSSLIGTAFKSTSGAVYHGLAWDDVNEHLYYLDSNTDVLMRCDKNGGSETQLASGFTRPNDITFHSTADRLIVTDSGSDKVSVFEMDGTLVSEVSVNAAGCWGVAVSPVDGRVFVSSYTQGKIYELNLDTPALVEKLSGLNGPRGLFFSRAGKLICHEAGSNTFQSITNSAGTLSSSLADYTGVQNGRGFSLFESTDRDGDFLNDTWELSHYPQLNSTDRTGDPEGDGMRSFTHYALDVTPRTNLTAIRSATEHGDGSITFNFHENEQSSIAYRYWISQNLTDWHVVTSATATGYSNTAIPASDYEETEVTVSHGDVALPAAGKLFFRIEPYLVYP